MTKLLIFTLFCLQVITANSQESKQNQNLIEKGAVVTKAGGGYLFTEGQAVAPDGRVFFTDQPNDKIDVWNENGTITTFMQPCDRSNGTYFNKNG